MPKKPHQKLTKKAEEYIEEIYRLQKGKRVARTSELAEKLDVALGSVISTIESLERKGYVIHQPYREVKLTEKGLKIAMEDCFSNMGRRRGRECLKRKKCPNWFYACLN